MMAALASALAVLAFLIVFHLAAVVPAARLAIKRAADAATVMRDAHLSDAQKETQIQQAALALLGSAGSIGLRFAASFIAALLPIFLLSGLGFSASTDTFAYLARWDVIVVSSVLITLAMVLAARAKARNSGSDYTFMDRMLHRLAFAAPFVQLTAADIEDTIFRKDIARIADLPPVFITGLPRAGTTIMLNALQEVPGVATHLYRDMPFVMSPLLWARLSGFGAKPDAPKQRAHGDGILVGYDSPEAFEEVLWRTFWPGKYHDNRIELWSKSDLNAEATAFFKRHFRKIVLQRCHGNGRYLSKNNGNIARLGLLPVMFPDATIIVPLRDPLEHAASLLRQHQLDAFVKRYMRDIGHLEFGALHRPIAFADFTALSGDRIPADVNYWLAYWIAAHKHILSQADLLQIVPQVELGTESNRVLSRLCQTIGLDATGIDFARHFHPVAPTADANLFDTTLRREASELYRALAKAPRAD